MNFLNTLTAPFGIKLAKGGPYPDKGYGDLAEGISNQLGAYGQGIMSNTAGGTPLTDLYGGVLAKYANVAGGTSKGAYDLQPAEQQLLNQQTGTAQTVQQRALAHAKSILAQQGHAPGSPIYEATLRQITDANANTNQTNATNFVTNQRQSNLTNLSSLLGQYANAIGLGSGLMGQQIQGYQNQASAARQDTANGQAAAMGTLGMLLSNPALIGLGAKKKADAASNKVDTPYNAGAGTATSAMPGGTSQTPYDQYGNAAWNYPVGNALGDYWINMNKGTTI